MITAQRPDEIETTLYVWYAGRMIPVKILDTFETRGVKLAAIESLEGKPFVDGAKTTTRTANLTVRLDTVYEIEKRSE